MHINCHTHNGEQYYFPAEIAAIKFNLKNGLSQTYHQIIGICKYLKYYSCIKMGPLAQYNVK